MQNNPQEVQMKIKNMLRFKKKKPLPIHVVKNIIYNQTQILIFQTHTDTENKSTTKTQLTVSYGAYKYK